jgi:hypothetical protein
MWQVPGRIEVSQPKVVVSFERWGAQVIPAQAGIQILQRLLSVIL